MDKAAEIKIKGMSVQLVVSNLKRSIAFYSGILGFEVDFIHQDFYAGLIKNNFSIHLKLGNPSAEERKNKRKHEDLDIIFSVEAVEDLYVEFVNKLVEITLPLCERNYGKEFYIADPDGYILAFLEEA